MEEAWFLFLAEQGVEGAAGGHWTGPTGRLPVRVRLGLRVWCLSATFPTFPSAGPIGMMSRAHVSKSVKFWAESLGFDPKLYSGTSFRRGSVLVAATQKIAVELR